MATWKQIKDYIRENYQLQEDEGDFFQMTFELEGDRSQIIFVQKTKSEAGDIWIQISSPIGIIEDDEINDALEMMENELCGGMVKIGERHFVRHNMLIDDLSPEQFESIMQIVMNAADKMEEKFIGGDDN